MLVHNNPTVIQSIVGLSQSVSCSLLKKVTLFSSQTLTSIKTSIKNTNIRITRRIRNGRNQSMATGMVCVLPDS